MKENEKILEEWNSEIRRYKRLKISEAKNMYEEAMRIDDILEKKKIIKEIITGTLYVISDYIAKNNYNLLSSSAYDMNDIINTFNEVWIKKIYNGELLSVNTFSSMITHTMINEVHVILLGHDIEFNNDLNISKELFGDLFKIYLNLKNKGIAFSINDVMDEYSEKLDFYAYSEYYFSLRKNVNTSIFNIFEIIYNSLDFDKIDGLNLSPTRIDLFIKLYAELGLIEPITETFVDDNNLEESIIDRLDKQEFMQKIDKIITNDIEKNVIYQKFGIDDGVAKTLDEVAALTGCNDKEKVRQISEKALRKLRRSDLVKHL